MLKKSLLILVLLLALTGCIHRTEGLLQGRAHLEGFENISLTQGMLSLDGPGGTHTAHIGPGGSFSFGQMLPGTYALKLTTLAGTWSQTVKVDGETTLTLPYVFPGYDPDEFALWSGRRYYAGNDATGKGLYQDRNGQRWQLGQGVSVWFDPIGGSHWAATYLSRMQQILSSLGGIIDLHQVYSSADAKLRVKLTDPGSPHWPGPNVIGLARVSPDGWGYIRQAEIELRTDYGANAWVQAHEFIHTLGVGHSQDPNSIMYWAMRSSGQRQSLSAREIRYTQALYSVEPVRIGVASLAVASGYWEYILTTEGTLVRFVHQ